ncbi:CRTAC1 family protein [Micromonospora sp. NPDC047074]|uniref:CRTAC1 family protein n=1 Tax=Micromonospora sp. NPDC047074 TaxID=3154339 RepID=UPI0033F6FF6B
MLVLVAAFFVVARLPNASAEERRTLASRFGFTELPIALPPGLPERTVRPVNSEYEHIRAWVSSVGAAVSANDLDGDMIANDLCLVDTRSDSVIVTPSPDGPARYAPFVLDPAPLPTHKSMAPMGCVPGDFNVDGLTDLLVYYWGRTPVMFLHRASAQAPLAKATFLPTELIGKPSASSSGEYQGKFWNTNAVAVADFDGDGRPDIGVFNYFPDSQVLDPAGHPNVEMNHSLSRAQNAGGAHVLRWTAATSGDNPSVTYVEQVAIAPEFSTGWTLGAGSADIDGDLLPELYLANDFGRDRFFHNVSRPGEIKFKVAEGRRGHRTPKSMVVGHDSFKGMSIEFGDLGGTGKFDMFVSNITSSWGLEESNFVWRNNSSSLADARNRLSQGKAVFDNKAAELNMAWVGWGWDAKMADFDNSGEMSVVQTAGFVKGKINRWSWLQELAMSNDLMLRNPAMWPKAEPGDDIAGAEPFAFWVREDNGRYANIAAELGMTDSTPSRGVAVADTNGDGGQDFAVARQWAAPSYYRNDKPGTGNFLGLRLCRPGEDGRGTPAYGAQVRVKTADGRTRIAQLDGGSGHSGKRSFDVFFGLGDAGDKPVSAEIAWRDLNGGVHKQTLDLAAGWHTIMLTDKAQEMNAQ